MLKCKNLETIYVCVRLSLSRCFGCFGWQRLLNSLVLSVGKKCHPKNVGNSIKIFKLMQNGGNTTIRFKTKTKQNELENGHLKSLIHPEQHKLHNWFIISETKAVLVLRRTRVTFVRNKNTKISQLSTKYTIK